ncbi:MAG: hypothetical protein AAGU12_06145 [Clostridiales bacterium]
MGFNSFGINVNFKSRACCGLFYFLVLMALAMALVHPIIMFFPAIFMAVIAFAFAAPEGKRGYVALALSVRKNE